MKISPVCVSGFHSANKVALEAHQEVKQVQLRLLPQPAPGSSETRSGTVGSSAPTDVKRRRSSGRNTENFIGKSDGLGPLCQQKKRFPFYLCEWRNKGFHRPADVIWFQTLV